MLPEKTDPLNSLRFPNTTNMHTHGLHISPKEEDVVVEARPGGDLSYEYNIEENHPSGTFWFHPHVHGSTLFQLHSGMAGMIIVEDEETDPGLSQQLKSVSCPFNCEHDIQLIFQPTLLYSNVKNAYKFASMQDDIEDGIDNLANYIVASTGKTFKDWISDDANGISYFTTNGQLKPTLNIMTGQLKRFRLSKFFEKFSNSQKT
uniref:Uncharacterized protein LOC100179801 n=1 Tax=Phallusia mammillata TaxID=59560 RepID=A0A6F9DHM0_9ASCI|nr:uncharacterized protein LOC100179801 [Phallusia mammillata]